MHVYEVCVCVCVCVLALARNLGIQVHFEHFEESMQIC